MTVDEPMDVASGVTVRYYAGARAAAGVAEEVVPAGLTLADLIDQLSRRHGVRLARVLSVASFLVDGLTCKDLQMRLTSGTTVDVLPPFAGG